MVNVSVLVPAAGESSKTWMFALTVTLVAGSTSVKLGVPVVGTEWVLPPVTEIVGSVADIGSSMANDACKPVAAVRVNWTAAAKYCVLCTSHVVELTVRKAGLA